MKLKFYLRGLGIGILVTTLILTVDYRVKDSQKTLTNNASTVSSALNLSKTETKAVSTEKSTEQKTEQKTEQQTSTTEPTTEVATESVTKNTTETLTESTQQIETVKDTSNTIAVVLSNISDSESAAQVIQNAGIIDNWIDFNNYLTKSGYAVKIHNGTYNLFKGQDYESIAKIITGK